MRIAYLHYQTADDTALHHINQFADAARQIGHQVDLYAMNFAPGGAADGPPSSAARLRAFAKRHAARYLHEAKEVLWNARYVPRELRLLRAARPDVLLVRDHLLTASCVPVARRLRLPLVLEVNAPADESRYYLDQYWHLPWLPERIERWKLSRADGITVVSTPLKTHLVRRYGLDPQRITVVPNGADVDAFHSAGDGAARRADGALVVGFVGSFQQWHGTALLRRLIDALAGPRVHFLLVGADRADTALRHSLVGEANERFVRLTGRVPHGDVPRYVAAMDVALIADAGFYQSPLKLLEYMAAGRAIVAPRHEAIEEVASHRRHALLFAPGDGADAAACVRQLLADAELRRDLGTAARARVAGELTWRHNAARVVAACSRALNETAQRRGAETRRSHACEAE